METENNKGFTLIELLISMLVASLLMAGIYSIFMVQVNVMTAQEQTAAVQQNIRSAMYILEQEIRMAGFSGNDADNNVGAGFTAATATSMTFTYVQDNDNIDNNGDNDIDETGELSTIAYTYADQDADGQPDTIMRAKDGGPATAVADNVEQLEYRYTLTDNSTALAPGTPNRIRSVEISMIVVSQKSIPGKTTVTTYTTASGDIWGDDESDVEGFYRRFMTSNIICRNL